MPATSGAVRTASAAVRSVHTFQLVGVVRQRRPTAFSECWDCGGTVTTCAGSRFRLRHLLESVAQAVDAVPDVGAPDHATAAIALPLAAVPHRPRRARSRAPHQLT